MSDCIEYIIYYNVYILKNINNQNNKNEKYSLISNILLYLKNYLLKYMWTNEEFCFDYEIENKLNKYLIIKGTTYFGENMDDEWFIVFLLYELSKKFNDITV